MIERVSLPRGRFVSRAEMSCAALRNSQDTKSQLLPGVSFLIGIFMAAGGAQRWKGQSLEVAMGFHGAPVILGLILMCGAIVLGCGVYADNGTLQWIGGWSCGIWHAVMMVFALFKLITSPTSVDDIAFILWFLLMTDYIQKALLHLSWGARDDAG